MLSFSTTFRLFSALATVFLLFAGSVAAQEADGVKKDVYVLKGKVTDAESGEEIPFANVIVKHESKQVGSAASHFDGFYEIKVDTSFNKVDVEFSDLDFHKKTVEHISFDSLVMIHLNANLKKKSESNPKEVIISFPNYKWPFTRDEYFGQGTDIYTREDFRRQFR